MSGDIIGIYVKGQSIKILMEFLNHSPLKGEKLQFMGRVVGLSLCETPTGRGDDGISSVIICLVEDSPPRPDPQVLVCNLKGLVKSA